jgi:hypothetical protein
MATYGKLNDAVFACDACGVEDRTFDFHEANCAVCDRELCTGCTHACGECGLDLCREDVITIPKEGHTHMNEYFCAACNASRLAVAA